MTGNRVLGHIDCPTCGTSQAMRITRDKNGDPFGFCEAGCNQQMRIGGSAHRVAAFVRRFPWAAKPATEQEAAAPAPAAPVAAKPTPPKPAAPKRSSAGFFDSLLGGGGVMA